MSVFLSGNQFVTKNFIIEAAKAHGIEDPYNNLTRIGRVFEDAALRSLNLEGKKQNIYPYAERPDKYFIPDALTDYTVTANKTSYLFKNAFITEAKFSTGNELKLEPGYNPEQLKGFIDYLGSARGVVINGVPTNDKIADYGAAALILVTPADLKISDDIINYAKDKNVALLKRIPIAVTSIYMKESENPQTDAIKNNKVEFTHAFVISPSENKKTGSELYKAQQEGEEKAGDNFYGGRVNINFNKK